MRKWCDDKNMHCATGFRKREVTRRQKTDQVTKHFSNHLNPNHQITYLSNPLPTQLVLVKCLAKATQRSQWGRDAKAVAMGAIDFPMRRIAWLVGRTDTLNVGLFFLRCFELVQCIFSVTCDFFFGLAGRLGFICGRPRTPHSLPNHQPPTTRT